MKDYMSFSKAQLINELDRLISEQEGTKNAMGAHILRHDLEVHKVELEMQNRELLEKQLELEAVRDQYADLYDFAPNGYVTLDKKGIIRAINLTATALLGQTRSQLLDKPFSAILVRNYNKTFHGVLQETINTGSNQNVEVQLKCKDKNALDMYLQMVLSQKDDATEVRVALVDIGAKKQAERELIQAMEQAQEANRSKSRFLTRMSHEFRTPLNGILGFAQLMDTNINEPLLPEQKESVDQILQSGWHMLELVNDLLDLAAIEADKIDLHMEAVDLNTNIKESVETIQPLIEQREIRLSTTIEDVCAGLYILADSTRFRQIILNLLSNAVKYNHIGGSIELSCEQINTDRVRISVTDSGYGIPAEDIPMLFVPFSRLYLKTYAKEGSGIGLSITKRLVECMGGQIGVTSELGQGSTFWIELQVSLPPVKTDVSTITESMDNASETRDETLLLYIEDNTSHIRLVKAIVHNMPGIRLLTAQTARLGLELAQAHRPDIIITDISLPDMNGFEVLNQLHANEITHEIPVIAVTANAMNQDVEKGRGAGFYRYLTKPLDLTEFRRTVDELRCNEVV